MIDLNDFMERCRNRLDNMFQIYMERNNSSHSLPDAMYYGVTNGGKRMRPLLVYATGLIHDVPFSILDIPATAIELIHSYSLIHDDLPAMDNADLRRGKLTCHKAFNDATAILAGDALQPLAFEIIATHKARLSPTKRIAMIQTLARASGVLGMAGGQALDMKGVTNIETLTEMYALKTGALIKASIQLAMDASQNLDNALLDYSTHLGFAFQLQDDLLDLGYEENVIGKSTGKDLSNHKITYPRLLGVERTQKEIENHYEMALKILDHYGNKAIVLRKLTEYLFQRKK